MANAIRVTDEDADDLAACRNLELLAISSHPTQLVEENPHLLRRLAHLTSLVVPGLLTTADVRSMRALSRLQRLQIRWDYLPVLSSLPQLTALALVPSTQASTALVAQLHALSGLKSLDLSTPMLWSMESSHIPNAADTVRLPGVELSQIACLTSLERLGLSGSSRVNSSSLGYLSALQRLTALDVSVCRRLDECAFVFLASLTDLRHLDVSWVDSVTSRNLASLQQLPHLESLCLAQCMAVDDSGAAHYNCVAIFQVGPFSWLSTGTLDGRLSVSAVEGRSRCIARFDVWPSCGSAPCQLRCGTAAACSGFTFACIERRSSC
jgi:hypothetical protein